MSFIEGQRPPEPIDVPLPKGINIMDSLFVDYATSTSGRPIIESEMIVPGDMVASPYPGTRNGYLMNEGSLKDVAAVWPQVLNGLAYINFQYFNGETPEKVTAMDINAMCRIALDMPIYFFNRGQNPLPLEGGLPQEVAAIGKVAAGISGFSDHMESLGREEEAISPVDVYQISEEAGLLVNKIGSETLACAAPKQMIIKALGALMYRQGSFENSTLTMHIPDFGALMDLIPVLRDARYEYLEFGANTFLPTYEILTRIAGGSIGSYEKIIASGLLGNYQVLERDFLSRLSVLQRDLNIHLGRDPLTAPTLSPADIDNRSMRPNPSVLAREILAF